MIREKKRQEIIEWCKSKQIELINLRHMTKQGKTRIIVTIKCSECGKRYDTIWDNLKSHEFAGLCTYCAHKKSSEHHRFEVQHIIDFIQNNGYKVLTPPEKINPVGKNKTYSRAKIEIEDSHGMPYEIVYNNFYNRLDYYKELNENGHCAAGNRKPSSLEQLVIQFLDEQGYHYKREFKFADCRGKKRSLPFDFCLDYDTDKKMLIEVDGERHYKPLFKELQKYDKTKNYYCKSKNIPLLRIPYWEFNEQENYKRLIVEFINTHSSNDTM